jgi:hypothetical protein
MQLYPATRNLVVKSILCGTSAFKNFRRAKFKYHTKKFYLFRNVLLFFKYKSVWWYLFVQYYWVMLSGINSRYSTNKDLNRLWNGNFMISIERVMNKVALRNFHGLKNRKINCIELFLAFMNLSIVNRFSLRRNWQLTPIVVL